MAGELKQAGLPVYFENCDVVGSLVTAIKESATGVESKAARILTASPFVAKMSQVTIIADRKDADTVVQAIACVDKLSIGRNQDFRAKVAACETGWQRRNGLPRR